MSFLPQVDIKMGQKPNQPNEGLLASIKANFAHILVGLVMVASLFNQYELQLFGLTPRIEHAIVLIVFPLYIIHLVFVERRKPRLDLPLILLGAWIFSNFLSSALMSKDPLDSFQHVIRFILLGCVYLMVANAFTTTDSWIKALKFWVAIITIQALYGIFVTISAYHFGTQFGVMSDDLITYPRPGGTIIEPNVFASLITSCYLILTSIWFWQGEGSKEKLIKNGRIYAALLVLGLANILALTRSTWLALIIGLIVIYIWFGIRRPSLVFRNVILNGGLLVIALILSLIIAMPRSDIENQSISDVNQAPVSESSTEVENESSPGSSTVQDRIGSLGQLDTDATVRQRFEELELAFQDWQRSPVIGNGTGSFGQIHGIRYNVKAWLSNIFARALVDTGVVGFILLSLFLGTTLLRAFALARRNIHSPIGAGSIALLSAMIALLIAYQATDASWLALFWIHLGLMAGPICSHGLKQEPMVAA